MGEERKLNASQLETLIDKTNLQIKAATTKKLTLKKTLNKERMVVLNQRSVKDVKVQIGKAEEFSETMRNILSELSQ